MTATSRARPLPYDLAFDRAFEETSFPAMEAEAGQRRLDLDDASQFLELQSVAMLLRSVLVESADSAVAQFGPLLFQAFHFWRVGKPVFDVTDPLFRHLVSSLPAIGRWPLQAPTHSGYLLLPRNRLWARIEENATAEAVDGFFWHAAPSQGPVTQLDVLVILGLVSGRPGFSVVPVSGGTDDEAAGHWGDAQARTTDGTDFENVLPGGEMQQLHALQTQGEVLKFVSRAFWYMATTAGAVQETGGRRVVQRV